MLWNEQRVACGTISCRSRDENVKVAFDRPSVAY